MHRLLNAFVCIGMSLGSIVQADLLYRFEDYPGIQDGHTLSGTIRTYESAPDDGLLQTDEITDWYIDVSGSDGFALDSNSNHLLAIEGLVHITPTEISIAHIESNFNGLSFRDGRQSLQYSRVSDELGAGFYDAYSASPGANRQAWYALDPIELGWEPWKVASFETIEKRSSGGSPCGYFGTRNSRGHTSTRNTRGHAGTKHARGHTRARATRTDVGQHCLQLRKLLPGAKLTRIVRNDKQRSLRHRMTVRLTFEEVLDWSIDIEGAQGFSLESASFNVPFIQGHVDISPTAISIEKPESNSTELNMIYFVDGEHQLGYHRSNEELEVITDVKDRYSARTTNNERIWDETEPIGLGSGTWTVATLADYGDLAEPNVNEVLTSTIPSSGTSIDPDSWTGSLEELYHLHPPEEIYDFDGNGVVDVTDFRGHSFGR